MNEKEYKARIISGRKVLITNFGIIEVHKFDKNHLIKNNGYYEIGNPLDNSERYIYIYRGKLRKNEYELPGSIYKKADGSYKWIAHDPDVKERYALSRCKEFAAIDQIKKVLDDPNTTYNEIDPDILAEGSGEYFAPKIRESDDILKRVVKTALQEMKININTLKKRFNNDYDLNNLKGQLAKPGAMSSKYFARWAEVLDLEIEVVIRNKPGSNKLPDEITVIMK